MTSDESKLEILRKVEDGTLSVEEGSDLIGILEAAKAASSEPEFIQPPNEPDEPKTQPEAPKVSGCWKAAWSMILLGGAVSDRVLSLLGLPGLSKCRAGLGVLAFLDSVRDRCFCHDFWLDPA